MDVEIVQTGVFHHIGFRDITSNADGYDLNASIF